MFRRLIVLVVVQDVLHYEDDVFDKLSVELGDDDLTLLIEELVDDGFDLLEEDGIQCRRHFVPH